MMSTLASATLPLLRLLEPERAHHIALLALRLGLAGRAAAPDDPRLAVTVLGLRLPNPIGLAAGFDKNALAVAPLLRLGFGHVEAGTVTPLRQPGNPRPRVFRLTEDRAVINRMGFGNDGIDAALRRLAGLPHGAPVGLNIGINKEGADPERDYPAMVAAAAPRSAYVAINVSSPNTPGLRDLQAPARLAGILAAVAARVPRHPPLLVKLAPDLAERDLGDIVEVCIAGGVRGLIVCNTTIARPPGLRSRHAGEAGGLSGAPLREPATRMLRRIAALAAGRLVLVGVGGIATGGDVLERMRAGAHLVQLYTAFALHGPALLARLKRELLAALREQGFASVADAVGVDVTGGAGAPG
jgi:dihydroorotate dehydrogenase